MAPTYGGLFDGFGQLVSVPQASAASQKTLGDSEEVSDIEKQIVFLDKLVAKYAAQKEEQLLLEQVASELAATKQREAHASQGTRPFLQKKITIVSHLYQVLRDLVQVQMQLTAIVTEHKDWLQQEMVFAKTRTKKEYEQRSKVVPTFEDVQKKGKQVADLREQIEVLEKERGSLTSDQNKRKKALDDIKKEYDGKKSQKKSFKQEDVLEDMQGLTITQQGELVDEQLRFLKYSRELAQLKFDEGLRRLELIDTKLINVRRKLVLIEADYAHLKGIVKVDDEQVKKARSALTKEQEEFEKQRNRIDDDIRLRVPILDEKKSEVQALTKQVTAILGDTDVLQRWNFDSAKLKKPNDWLIVCKLGLLVAQQNTIETELKNLKARVDEANFALKQKDLTVNILRSWYNLTRNSLRLNVSKVLSQDLKKYGIESSQLKADMADFVDRRDKAITSLYNLNLAREEIKKHIKTLKNLHNTPLTTEDPVEQAALLSLINSDAELSERIRITTQLMESYAKSLALIQDMLKSIGEVTREISERTFWMRSGKSIEWRELTSFWSDICRFFHDLKRTGEKFWENLGAKAFEKKITALFGNIYYLVMFALQLMLLLLGFLLVRTYMPVVRDYCFKGGSRYRALASLRFTAGILIDFSLKQLKGLYLWGICVFIGRFFDIHPFFVIYFYLLSIPYFLYLAYGFFKYLARINEEQGYRFVSKRFKRQFELVVPSFVYATIVILFFRQAFILGNNFSSQVPEILKALNFILFQLALIALLSKDSLIGQSHVLGVISRTSPFGKWLEERLNRYYYVFLFILTLFILAINPYVGYGRQVFYVLSRLIISILLIPLFSWVYESVKRASSDFFFYYPDGLVVKERFGGGKTWYGFFIIASFLLFVFIGALVFGYIWDQGITLKDLSKLFKYTLYNSGVDELTGQLTTVTLASLFNIVLYLLGGLSVVYIVNRFVLQRIFDPLLVGSGVQSTIMTLSRYVIVVTAILIGLNSAGLGTIVAKLWFIVGAIAFVIREPLGDFFSYFIILVQRPIKIGDYVELDDPFVQGVVRHITPRLTVIRNKNSVTYLVPNSTIITKTLRNWHYSRSFSATDDIALSVAHSVDQEKVRMIMLQALEEHPAILRNPAPIVWLTDITESGYKFMVRGFISSDRIMDKWDIESQIRFALIKKLQSEHIPLAHPIRMVTMQPYQGKDGVTD